ncbi:MAG TPA: helix-turn-helix transcriptional regulator [Candidatus Megaira endosymbiont of Nemacystus decipiens]|nr:helix-turn-helix transcriptional regulator [Candidatus Megaera endosymbiont of Nemacystus decipiens]
MARKNDFISEVDNFVGNKIFSLRLAKGYSRQQLSDVIGVTHQQLQKYEKGTNRISVGRLVLIAKALGKDPSYFYEGISEASKEDQQNTKHQRMCIEISRNFMKIGNTEHQNALNSLIKSLAKVQAAS